MVFMLSKTKKETASLSILMPEKVSKGIS